jgi:hypothetical protein
LYKNTELMLTDAELKKLKETLKNDYDAKLNAWAD